MSTHINADNGLTISGRHCGTTTQLLIHGTVRLRERRA